jgi:hypothetical protein
MPATAVIVNHLDHKTALLKPTALACDATNGNSADNGGTLLLELNNSGAAAYTVTVAFAAKLDGLTPAPLSYDLAAGETKIVGGWPPATYGQKVVFTASNVAVKYIAYDV